MPVEQVGQQHSRPLLFRPRRRFRGNASHQRGSDPGHLGILGRPLRLIDERARQLFAGPFGQIKPPVLQPVPQRQRGPAVVLVVPGHHPLPPGVTRRRPVLQCRLELDQAGRRLPQVHLPPVPAQRFQSLDRVALHPGLHALPDDPVQVHEHPEPEQVVHLVLAGREPPHQPAHRLLARAVQLGEMVDRRRLVVVVVVHVQPWATRAALGDEVDQLLERALLARPAEGPEGRVPRAARLVEVGCVHHPEQVLQPELLTVLGVVPGTFDVEEQVAGNRLRQREEPAVRDQGPAGVPLRVQQPEPDDPFVLAGHLQPGLGLGAHKGIPAHPLQPGEFGPAREPAPGGDPGRLQCPPLPRRHPGDQGQVVVDPPAPGAQVAPPADRAVLDRLGVQPGRRARGEDLLQPPAGLPFVRREVPHLERDELPVAERQVHPAWLGLLQFGQQPRVERGLQNGPRLRRPGQLGVHHLVMPSGRPRLPVRRRQQVRPHQEVRPPEQPRAGQRALVDHPGLAPDGRRRRPGRIPGPAQVRHLTPVRPEPLEHRPLVLLAAPHQVLEAEVDSGAAAAASAAPPADPAGSAPGRPGNSRHRSPLPAPGPRRSSPARHPRADPDRDHLGQGLRRRERGRHGRRRRCPSPATDHGRRMSGPPSLGLRAPTRQRQVKLGIASTVLSALQGARVLAVAGHRRAGTGCRRVDVLALTRLDGASPSSGRPPTPGRARSSYSASASSTPRSTMPTCW